MKRIYFDHAATTPLDKRVKDAMEPFLSEHFGNPSSLHYFGQNAGFGVIQAQKEIARALGAEPLDIFFTSGATESNNWALFGIARAWKKQHGEIPHFIVSSIEHPSVLNTARVLEKDGEVELNLLPVSSDGIVLQEKLCELVRENTALVSVMMVNNELGSVQPINAIGSALEERNKNRKRKIFFHVDAVQGFGYFPVRVKDSHIDLLSLSAHKWYGPKGIGALYVGNSVSLLPLFYGGAQQTGMRAGTIPVFLAVGFGEAVRLAEEERVEHRNYVAQLSAYFREQLLKKFPDIRMNASALNCAPHIVNFSFLFGKGESMAVALDVEGIAVSAGAACASGSVTPSGVLCAIHLSEKYIQNSIRVSFGKNNTKKEIDIFLEILEKILKRTKNA